MQICKIKYKKYICKPRNLLWNQVVFSAPLLCSVVYTYLYNVCASIIQNVINKERKIFSARGWSRTLVIYCQANTHKGEVNEHKQVHTNIYKYSINKLSQTQTWARGLWNFCWYLASQIDRPFTATWEYHETWVGSIPLFYLPKHPWCQKNEC